MQDKSTILSMGKGPTLKELAAVAGVSVATACRALNDLPGVGSSKKDRINKLAREMGYRPHEVARSLVLQKTGFVGLIISHLENPFLGSLAQEIENELKNAGYSVLLYIDNGPYEKAVQLMLSRRVDAIIAGPMVGNPNLISAVESSGALPCIFFGSAKGVNSSNVRVDAFNGVREAVHYLHGKGYRKLGFIGRAKTIKLEAVRHGAKECGLSINEDWVLDRSGTMESGYEATGLLLKQKERPDCIICHNDLAAMGALKALAESGVSCPEDMAVLGYDGIDMGAFCTPSLTTIRQPVSLITSAIVDMLKQRLAGQEPAEMAIMPKLIVRQSA